MQHSIRAPVRRRLLSLILSIVLVVGLTAFLSAQADGVGTGGVSGTVTVTTGGGHLAGINVDLFTLNTDDPGNAYWDYYDNTVTLVDGTYSFTDLPADHYRVGFTDYDGNYVPEFWNNVADVDLATDVVVTTGDIPNIDASLGDAGHIPGHVTNSGDEPLENIYVEASVLLTDGSETYWHPVNGASTDATGNFNIGGLGTGTYRIGYHDGNEPAAYITEFWNDKPTIETATDIAVHAGAMTSAKDAVLAVGGHVTGRVTGPNDGALPGTDVAAYHLVDDSSGSHWEGFAWGYTDGSGRYDIGGIPDGNVRIGFDYYDPDTDTSPYLSQFFDNKPTVDEAADIPISDASTVTGKNVKLTVGSGITNVEVPKVTPVVTPVVGNSLTASRGSWLAPADATYGYQWLADGVAIPGATSSSYRPVAGDVGKKVSVAVTGARTGLASVTAKSAQTVAVIAVPPNVLTTKKIVVDASGRSRINVKCLQACVGYLQVRTSEGATSAAETSRVVKYTLKAGAYAGYDLSSVPMGATTTAKVRMYQVSPNAGVVQFNDLQIVRAVGNVLKTTSRVTVDAYGRAKVNVSCTMACEGYAQLRSDEAGTKKSGNVVHYKLSGAGYTAMYFTSVPSTDSDSWLTRLAIVSPAAFPGDSPQFNPLELVKAAGNVLKTSASTRVSASGRATVYVSCTMACEGYAQLRSDEAGTKKSGNVVHYKLSGAGYTAMYFTGVPYEDSSTWLTRLAITSPPATASPVFNSLNLIKG